MVTAASQRRSAPSVSRATVRKLASVLAIVVLGMVCVGGYLFRWRWSGLYGSVTLWNWLEVLALPFAIAAAPLLLRYRRGLQRRHHLMILSTLTGFAAVVLAGYVVPLAWTGFPGNTVWDWLQLVLLPLVVATTSLLSGTHWQPRTWQIAVAGLGLGVFAIFVIAGYVVPMKWTGFTGNTMWDWLKLLLLPVVVPAVLVPMFGQRVSERLAPPDPDPDSTPDSTPDPELSADPPTARADI